MAKPEFVSLPGGGMQITLRTGQMKGGIAAIVIGLIGLGIVAALSFGLEAHFCLIFGCGGIAGLVALLGVWGVIHGRIVGARLGNATLTLSSYPLKIGERFTVTYEQPVRSTHDIEFVELTLTCEETARYRVGTDTRTVRHTALQEHRTLLEGGTATPEAPLASAVEFEIPPGAMHTFDQSNNKILWTLKLRVDIAKLPDYVAECPLEVSPRLANSAGGPAPHAHGPGEMHAADRGSDADEEDA